MFMKDKQNISSYVIYVFILENLMLGNLLPGFFFFFFFFYLVIAYR